MTSAQFTEAGEIAMVGAGSVPAARPATQQAGGGANPALHALQVRPVPLAVAKVLLVRHHYLHSLPGGTQLAFGVFVGNRLMGALTLGVGNANAHRLVHGARAKDCLVFGRLWLADSLPRNSESRVLGVVLRLLRRHTSVKFLVTYADPSQGHFGTIYQASNWLYIGLSEAMPRYDVGDGVAHHSRSLSHAYGSHSVQHFARHGVTVRTIAQARKHRYVFFLEPTWRDRLVMRTLPYPKRERRYADR